MKIIKIILRLPFQIMWVLAAVLVLMITCSFDLYNQFEDWLFDDNLTTKE